MVTHNENATDRQPEQLPADFGLDPQRANDTVSFRDLLATLHRRRRTVLITWVVVTLLTAGVVLSRSPKYKAATLLVIAAQKATPNASSDTILSPLQALTQSRNTDTQVEVLQSPELIRQAFNRFSKADQERGFKPNAEERSVGLPPEWCYRIINKEDTDAVTIEVNSYNPQLGALFANAIAQTYLDRDLQQNNEATQQAREYVEKELTRAKSDLTAKSAELENLKKHTGLVAADAQVTAEATRLYSLKSAVDTAQSQLSASQQKVAQLQGQLSGAAKNVPAETNSSTIDFSRTIQQNPVYVTELGRLNDLLAQRAQVAQEFTPGSPEAQELDKRISDQRTVLARTAQSVLGASTTQANPVRQQLLGSLAAEIANQSALQAQIASGRQSVAQSEKAMSSFPTLQRELAETALDVDVLQNTYKSLYDKWNTLLVQEHSNLPNGIIASAATPAPKPYFPNPVLTVILAILGGLVVAVASAIGAERLDSRVHDPSIVESTLGASMLTLVPKIAEVEEGGQRPLLGADTTAQHGHGLLEAYRTLRNNLYFLSPDRPARVIGLTSPGASEGKTTTTINLAIALGLDGKKVLVLDGDLRKPAVAAALGLSRAQGLSTVVAGLTSLDDAIIKTNYENVSVLPSGPLPPNPTEFLNSSRCAEVIHSATDRFDYVLMDCPPTAGISDVQIISRIVDGMVVVVALDRTNKPALEITARTLRQAGARVLGLVMNLVESGRPGYYGYYGYYNYYSYYYQSYYGQEPENGKKRSKKKAAKK